MKTHKFKIPCDMLLVNPCPKSAIFFFRAEFTDRRTNETKVKYVARCPYHDACRKAHKLEEISRENFIVAQVMES